MRKPPVSAVRGSLAQILKLTKRRTKDEELAGLYYYFGQELKSVHAPLDRIISVYRESLRLNKANADAHYELGNAFFPHRLEEAISEYHETIRINKNHAQAHTNLGNCLATKGDLDAAIREYRTALGINKNLFEAHLNLGVALRLKGQADEAIPECQAAIRINKKNANAHDKLGLAWQAKGRLKDAVAEYREAIRLQKNNAEAKDHLHQAERLVLLQERLPAALTGKEKSKDAAELLAFAQLCLPPYSQHYAAAARFFGAAFAAEPKLAENLQAEHRYNAACAAALAGCGHDKDADKLDDKERARLRRQALDWLRADLEAWGRLLNKEPEQVRPAILQQLRHWLEDKDFAGVRGPQALAKLPEAERQSWQKLWDDVANTLARVQPKTTPPKESREK